MENEKRINEEYEQKRLEDALFNLVGEYKEKLSNKVDISLSGKDLQIVTTSIRNKKEMIESEFSSFFIKNILLMFLIFLIIGYSDNMKVLYVSAFLYISFSFFFSDSIFSVYNREKMLNRVLKPNVKEQIFYDKLYIEIFDEREIDNNKPILIYFIISILTIGLGYLFKFNLVIFILPFFILLITPKRRIINKR